MHNISKIIAVIFLVALHNTNAQKIRMLKDINEGGDDGMALFISTNIGSNMPVINNGYLFFSAKSNDNKEAIWKSDGANEGTVKIGGDTPLHSISNMCSYNNSILFSANDGVHGEELWILDVKNEKLSLVKDLWEGEHPSYPRNFALCDNQLLFEVNIHSEDPSQQLYVTNGTQKGTHPFYFLKVDSMKGYGIALAGSTINLPPLLFKNYALLGEVYFGRVGMTDLTTKVTEILSDLQQVSGQRNFTTYKKDTNFVFISYSGTLEHLWISDGTDQNTNIIFSAGRIFSPTKFNGEIYFWARDTAPFADYWLMRTDGTSEGTKRVKYFHDIAWHGYGRPDDIVVFKNKLFFSTIDSDEKSVLWMSNGGENSTVPIADIEADLSNSVIFDDRLYFAGYTPSTGWEVWYINPDNNTPTLFQDLYEGSESSLRPQNSAMPLPCFFTYNNKLFFQANDGIYGTEYHFIESETETGIINEFDISERITFEMDGANKTLTVSNIPQEKMYFEVYNYLGEKILSKDISSTVLQFGVQDLISGNYIFILHNHTKNYSFSTSVIQ